MSADRLNTRANILYVHPHDRAELYLSRTARSLGRELPVHGSAENIDQFHNLTSGSVRWRIIHAGDEIVQDAPLLDAIKAYVDADANVVLAVQSDARETVDPVWLRIRAVWQRPPADIDEWLAMIWELINMAADQDNTDT